MAVVVQCFHCNTILELDEGFRGGVCRCSTCGSLLQVPRATTTSAPKARPAAPGAQPTQTDRPASPVTGSEPGLSRGQFETSPGSGLAGRGGSGKRPAIPDMGGSSSALRQARGAASTATIQTAAPVESLEPHSGPARPTTHLAEVKRSNRLVLISFILLGTIAIIAVATTIYLLVGGEEKRTPTTSTAGTTNTPPREKPPISTPTITPDATNTNSTASPNTPLPAAVSNGFLGISLSGKKIVISIDGASSMSENFDYIRAAVYQALGHLRADQQLQVAVWRDDKITAYPGKGFISKSELDQLKADFDNLTVRGSSDISPCMIASLGLGADQVIFITAKPGLDTSLAAEVLAAKKGVVRLDSIKIDAEDSPSPLEELAHKTGGAYFLLSSQRIQRMVAP